MRERKVNRQQNDKIGVLGGSFDPPHSAHLMVASYALSTLALKKLIVVPCFTHPFGKQSASFDDRLQMCRLAFSCFGKSVEVSDIEDALPKPSYTENTLEELTNRHKKSKLILLLGTDTSYELERWHNFKKVSELAEVYFFKRGEIEIAPSVFYPVSPVAFPDISSTGIRRLIEFGRDITGLVPQAVAEYIFEKHLYK